MKLRLIILINHPDEVADAIINYIGKIKEVD
jgi:hypothetical protein